MHCVLEYAPRVGVRSKGGGVSIGGRHHAGHTARGAQGGTREPGFSDEAVLPWPWPLPLPMPMSLCYLPLLFTGLPLPLPLSMPNSCLSLSVPVPVPLAVALILARLLVVPLPCRLYGDVQHVALHP